MDGELERLLSRIAHGDRRAFERLCARTGPALNALCLRILNDRGAAEAALADAFATIWRHAERFPAAGVDAATFVVAIARNHAIDRLRARRGPADALRAAERAATGAGRGERRRLAGSAPRLDAALDAMGARDAGLVRLAYFGGVSDVALAERERSDAAPRRFRGALATLGARLGLPGDG